LSDLDDALADVHAGLFAALALSAIGLAITSKACMAAPSPPCQLNDGPITCNRLSHLPFGRLPKEQSKISSSKILHPPTKQNHAKKKHKHGAGRQGFRQR